MIGFLLVLGFRSPCKNLKSYDNPFWVKSKEGKKCEKIPKIVAYGCQTPSAQRRSDQFGNSKPPHFPEEMAEAKIAPIWDKRRRNKSPGLNYFTRYFDFNGTMLVIFVTLQKIRQR